MPWVLSGRITCYEREARLATDEDHWLRPGRLYRIGRSIYTKFKGVAATPSERMHDFPIASAAVPSEGLCDLVVGDWNVADALGNKRCSLVMICRKAMNLNRDGQKSKVEPSADGFSLKPGDKLEMGSSVKFSVEWIECCVHLEADSPRATGHAVDLGLHLRKGKDFQEDATHFVAVNAKASVLKCQYSMALVPIVGLEPFLETLAAKTKPPAFPPDYPKDVLRKPSESFTEWEARVYSLPPEPVRAGGSSEAEHEKALEEWNKMCSKQRRFQDSTVFSKFRKGDEVVGADFGAFFLHCALELSWRDHWPDDWDSRLAATSKVGSDAFEWKGEPWIDERRNRRSHVFSSVLLVDVTGDADAAKSYKSLMTKGQGLYLHLSNKDLSSAETALAAIEKFRKSKDKEAENKRVILLANEPVDLTAGQDLEGEYQTFADIGKKYGVDKTIDRLELQKAIYEVTNHRILPPPRLLQEPSSSQSGSPGSYVIPGTHPFEQTLRPPQHGSTFPESSSVASTSKSAAASPVKEPPSAAHPAPARPRMASSRLLKRRRSLSSSSQSSDQGENDDDEQQQRGATSLDRRQGSAAPSSLLDAGGAEASQQEAATSQGTKPARSLAEMRRKMQRKQSSSDDDDDDDSDDALPDRANAKGGKSKSVPDPKRRKLADRGDKDAMQVDEEREAAARKTLTAAERKQLGAQKLRELKEREAEAQAAADAKRREKEEASTARTSKSNKKRNAAEAAVEAGQAAEAKVAGASGNTNGLTKLLARGGKKNQEAWAVRATEDFEALWQLKKRAVEPKTQKAARFEDASGDKFEEQWEAEYHDMIKQDQKRAEEGLAEGGDSPSKWFPVAPSHFRIVTFKMKPPRHTVSAFGRPDVDQEGENENGNRPNFKLFKKRKDSSGIRPNKLTIKQPPPVLFGMAEEDLLEARRLGQTQSKQRRASSESDSDLEDEGKEETDPAFKPVRDTAGPSKSSKTTTTTGGSKKKPTIQQSTLQFGGTRTKRAAAASATAKSKAIVLDSSDDEGQKSSETVRAASEAEDAPSQSGSRSQSQKRSRRDWNEEEEEEDDEVVTTTKGKKASGAATKRTPKRGAAKKAATTQLIIDDSDESDTGGRTFKGLAKATQPAAGRGVKRTRF